MNFLRSHDAQYIPTIIPAPRWILLIRLFELLGSLTILGIEAWTIWAFGAGADFFLHPPVLSITTCIITLLALPLVAPILAPFRALYHSWFALALDLLCVVLWTASATAEAILCAIYTALVGLQYVPFNPLAVAASVYLTNSTCTNAQETVDPAGAGYYTPGQLSDYLSEYANGTLPRTVYFTNQRGAPLLQASRAGWTAYRLSLGSAVLSGVLALAFAYTFCCYCWWFVQAYVRNAALGRVDAGPGFKVEGGDGEGALGAAAAAAEQVPLRVRSALQARVAGQERMG